MLQFITYNGNWSVIQGYCELQSACLCKRCGVKIINSIIDEKWGLSCIVTHECPMVKESSNLHTNNLHNSHIKYPSLHIYLHMYTQNTLYVSQSRYQSCLNGGLTPPPPFPHYKHTFVCFLGSRSWQLDEKALIYVSGSFPDPSTGKSRCWACNIVNTSWPNSLKYHSCVYII